MNDENSRSDLADECLGAIESRDERIHQHRQVRQQRAEADGNGEAKFDKEILHVLLVQTALKAVQACVKLKQFKMATIAPLGEQNKDRRLPVWKPTGTIT